MQIKNRLLYLFARVRAFSLFPFRKFNFAFLSQRILTIFSCPASTATWSGVSKLIIEDDKKLILPDIPCLCSYLGGCLMSMSSPRLSRILTSSSLFPRMASWRLRDIWNITQDEGYWKFLKLLNYFDNLWDVFPWNFWNFDNDGLITYTMSSNFTNFENSKNKLHIKIFYEKSFSTSQVPFSLSLQCHKLNNKI